MGLVLASLPSGLVITKMTIVAHFPIMEIVVVKHLSFSSILGHVS